MKKTILFCLSALLIVGLLVSCSSSPKDETAEVITKGTATVSGSTTRTSCGWVQLWENGPKFAEFNVGSTINSYSEVTGTGKNWGSNSSTGTGSESPYCLATCGGHYAWLGSVDDGSKGTLGTDETATDVWGSNWKMPTKTDLEALLNNCT